MRAMRAMRATRVTSTREKLIMEIHETSGKLTKARRRHEIAGDVVTILEVHLFTLQQRYNHLLQPMIAKLREELPKARKRQNIRHIAQKVKKAKKTQIRTA